MSFQLRKGERKKCHRKFSRQSWNEQYSNLIKIGWRFPNANDWTLARHEHFHIVDNIWNHHRNANKMLNFENYNIRFSSSRDNKSTLRFKLTFFCFIYSEHKEMTTKNKRARILKINKKTIFCLFETSNHMTELLNLYICRSHNKVNNPSLTTSQIKHSRK